jgi:hypothetical protein
MVKLMPLEFCFLTTNNFSHVGCMCNSGLLQALYGFEARMPRSLGLRQFLNLVLYFDS